MSDLCCINNVCVIDCLQTPGVPHNPGVVSIHVIWLQFGRRGHWSPVNHISWHIETNIHAHIHTWREHANSTEKGVDTNHCVVVPPVSVFYQTDGKDVYFCHQYREAATIIYSPYQYIFISSKQWHADFYISVRVLNLGKERKSGNTDMWEAGTFEILVTKCLNELLDKCLILKVRVTESVFLLIPRGVWVWFPAYAAPRWLIVKLFHWLDGYWKFCI